MVDVGTTGIWIGEDDVETVEAFDEYFERQPGTYHRSERIKEAMAIYPTLHHVFEESTHKSIEDMSVPERRSLLRSLVLFDDATDE